MPSGAIIHEEIFHKCMAVTNTATRTSAILQGKLVMHRLSVKHRKSAYRQHF